jgi:hypothetical protein
MQIILTHDEKRKLFEESLQYLAESLQDWNFTLDFNRTEFEMAKQILKRKSSVVTYDELFTEMVFNNWELKFIDNEDEDNIIVFDLEQLNNNLILMNPFDVLNIINENGDYDYYVIDRVLQTFIFGDVVYG